MCTFDILHVMHPIVFELRNNQLLDQTIACQLKNDYTLFQGQSSRKLHIFSLFKKPGGSSILVYKRYRQLWNDSGNKSLIV
jgi:hypothetical protein